VTATITVDASTPLPARVQAGFAVGGQNVQGDGGADLLNCGMIVDSRVSDTQFTTLLRSSGVDLAAFTTPDNTASLGLTPNRLCVPKCTIRANEAGWDGAAREAFMNVFRGGKIDLMWVGLSYNGAAGDNDMLFARDAGAEINLRDYVVVAGAGEMVARSFNQGNILTNRSFLGGGQTGANIWQGSGGGTLSATRTMMGSVSGDAISDSSGAYAVLGNCVVAGCNQGLRTTTASSTIIATTTRVSRAANGIAATKGNVSIDAASSIKNCTSPIIVSGSASGTVNGDPTISDNTNATVAAYATQASSGVWLQGASKPYDTKFQVIGKFSAVCDFPSIAAGGFADLTIAGAGALAGDFCIVVRGAMPTQAILYEAFCNVPDVITVRAYNTTGGAVNPAAFTPSVLVARSS